MLWCYRWYYHYGYQCWYGTFQYSIDGGQNFQFNNVFDQLSAGTYDVIVTDGNGCLIQEDVTINPPSPQIEVVAGGSDGACNNTSTGDVWVESIMPGLPSVAGFTYTWYSTDNNQVIGYGSLCPVFLMVVML